MKPQNVIIYVRISDDKAEDAKGVGRQEDDCRALADRLGWRVLAVIPENDVSAYKRRKVTLPDGSTGLRVVREGFRRALDLLTSGEADGMIAYDLDRVARDPRDLEDLIDVVKDRKLAVSSVTGSLRLDTSADQAMARIMCTIAHKSSEDTSRRVTRKHQELAAEGKPGGGGFRGYGYTRDGLDVIPAEAGIVCEIARRVLDDDDSLNAIAADLEVRNVPTVTGAAWNARSVRSVVTKPRVAGLRTFRGEVVGEAVWDAVLDREVWEEVCARLADRGRSVDITLKRWLSGVLRCSACGALLTGALGNGGARYWCNTTRGGCGKIAVTALAAETEVERQVLDLLTRPRVLDRLTHIASTEVTDDARRELAEDEEQLKEMARGYARKELTYGEYMEARKIIESRVKESRALVHSSAPRALRALLAGDIVQGWKKLTPAGKRDIVLTIVPGYTVMPHDKHAARRFDPARLVPIGLPNDDTSVRIHDDIKFK